MSEIVTYYLQMMSPGQLKAKNKPGSLEVVEAQIKQYQLNRFLYQLVGEKWHWTDKLSLTDEQWRQYAESEDLRTWVAYYRGAIAGYYELQKQADANVQIAYFGLAPRFIGKGFGGYLLSDAIRSAWAWDEVSRVWVHTCTLDHAAALDNYRARGFEVYRQVAG